MDKKEILKKFLETNEVLIVDKNTSSRSRLMKTMLDLGAAKHMIHSCGNMTEAEDYINTKKIGIVLSDYIIGGGSGFDLFKMLRAKYPTNKELCLILVTSNISQSAVAKAAEEDVDSFVIKPYTVQSIQENLFSTVTQKVQPSKYQLKIEEGKAFIAESKYQEALAVLQEAIPLHSKPALALFYIGQAEYLQALKENAAGSYNKGLGFNSIHFKCLVGLFDLLMKDNKHFEAYEVVKKISKYFPSNPERLSQVIHLTVKTQNFADMKMYYDLFTEFEERAPATINYIGAGLYIAGKHYVLEKNFEQAMLLFDCVAVSCSEFTKFIRAIVSLLVEHERGNDAEKFLTRFPSGADEMEDYIVSNYLVTYALRKDNNHLIRNGLDMYNKKIMDPQCLSIMIRAMRESGYKEDKIRPFEEDFQRLSPVKVA
jgi:CheY-like chemotaxis protein